MEVALASGNAGKLREFQKMLAGSAFRLRPQQEFGISSAEETGQSFLENALLKARHAARHAGMPALADDSGLCVAALDGAPGIRSARYAGEQASDEDNLRKLLTAMEDVPEERRHACFFCVLAYVRDERDPMPVIAQGIWHGVLLREAQGEGGFGYDPIFYLPEEGRTSAELDPQRKNQLSHRGQALRAFQRAWERFGGAPAASLAAPLAPSG